LGFCPTPHFLNKADVLTDCLILFRKLKLCIIFPEEKKNVTQEKPMAKCLQRDTGWTPTIRNPALDACTTSFSSKVLSYLKKQPQATDNLSRPLRSALKELKLLNNVVIKKADKGGAVVLWDKDNYITEVYSQIRDNTKYERIQKDPTAAYTKDLSSILSQLERHLPDGIYDRLKPKNCVPGTFYLLPKIHKLKTINPANAKKLGCTANLDSLKLKGRPICSQINTVTEKISAYVDRYLQPLAQSVQSFVKDTNDLISKIEKINLQDDNFLMVQ
jgi:hypothetical protein